MQLAHLVFQHWFLTCILLSVTGGSVARIILACKGKEPTQ